MNMDYSKCKILVVDDNVANLDILVELLNDYDVRAALSGISALESVQDELPDLIFLDIAMPDMDGFEVCKRLKSNPKTASIPIIFLSASSDSKTIVKGFELGGVDYIVKPYNVKEVIARLHTHLKLQYAIKKLDRLAFTDHLTGISNRRRFFTTASKLFVQAKTKAIPMHLMVIDIDNFKQINDTYGHNEADMLLKQFAKQIRDRFSSNALCARLGGDEFAIFVLNLSQQQALEQAEKLCQTSANLRVGTKENIEFTVSIGLVEAVSSIKTLDDLVAQANINLQEAKSVKNRVIGYV